MKLTGAHAGAPPTRAPGSRFVARPRTRRGGTRATTKCNLSTLRAQKSDDGVSKQLVLRDEVGVFVLVVDR